MSHRVLEIDTRYVLVPLAIGTVAGLFFGLVSMDLSIALSAFIFFTLGTYALALCLWIMIVVTEGEPRDYTIKVRIPKYDDDEDER